jgi:hypothetical protein
MNELRYPARLYQLGCRRRWPIWLSPHHRRPAVSHTAETSPRCTAYYLPPPAELAPAHFCDLTTPRADEYDGIDYGGLPVNYCVFVNMLRSRGFSYCTCTHSWVSEAGQ